MKKSSGSGRGWRVSGWRVPGVALFAGVLLLSMLAVSGCGPGTMTLGTTLSVEQSGLLAKILPDFEKQYDTSVTVVAKDSTAEALKLGEQGNVDVLLVNSRGAFDEFVEGGQGINEADVMYRGLIVVGPSSDPAKLRGVPCMGMCNRMAASGTEVLSCGDGSDIDKMVVDYWQKCGGKTGVQTEGQGWFVVTGQPMVQTLQAASDKQCYAITDRLTWVQNEKNLNLEKLVDRCGMLYDQYGVVVVNPAKHSDKKLNTKAAKEFAGFMADATTQETIESYTRSGTVLYYTSVPVK